MGGRAPTNCRFRRVNYKNAREDRRPNIVYHCLCDGNHDVQQYSSTAGCFIDHKVSVGRTVGYTWTPLLSRTQARSSLVALLAAFLQARYIHEASLDEVRKLEERRETQAGELQEVERREITLRYDATPCHVNQDVTSFHDSVSNTVHSSSRVGQRAIIFISAQGGEQCPSSGCCKVGHTYFRKQVFRSRWT